MIDIVDGHVHSRQADHIMQLVPALVDLAELRHESARLETVALTDLGQHAVKQTDRSLLLKERTDLLTDK